MNDLDIQEQLEGFVLNDPQGVGEEEYFEDL
jgi:hypothetical protein